VGGLVALLGLAPFVAGELLVVGPAAVAVVRLVG